MFVQRTEDSCLLKELRKEEETLSRQSGYRVKLVERSGNKLKELLVKADPFEGKDCGRTECAPCGTKAITLKWKICWKQSCNYKATCFRCKEAGTTAEYYGETSKSIQKRSQGHLNKLKDLDPGNFMVKHNVTHHLDEDPQDYQYLWTAISHQ